MLFEDDLASSGFGLQWGHTRSYNNSLAGTRGGNLNGNLWSVAQIPSIQTSGNFIVAVVGRNRFWFASSGLTSNVGGLSPLGGPVDAAPIFPFKARIKLIPTPAEYQLVVDDAGTVLKFDALGKFKSVVNPAGDEMVAQYDSYGRLVSLPLASSTVPSENASYIYTYVGSGTPADKIASVLYQVNGVNVRRASYTYYGVGDINGNQGDLETATVEGWDASASAWFTIRQFYYRYWKPVTANGYVSGIKYVVGAQAYANMVAAGLNPMTAADAVVAQYADLYLEYLPSYQGMAVTKEVTDGGTYTYTFDYDPSGGDAWAMKTTETLPGIGSDGTHDRNVVYTTEYGQVILSVFISAGQQWCTYFEYGAGNACVLMAEPSAVASYSETGSEFVTLKTSTGLIRRYDYDADGRCTQMSVQQGSAGSPVKTQSMTYTYRSPGGLLGVYRLASETLYQSDAGGGTNPATTSYAYTWQGSSLQVDELTQTWPVVSTTQNGSGTADSVKAVYDRFGNVTWTMDERGFIAYTAYDPCTRGLIQSIKDVQTSGMSGVPTGWSTPTGGGLNLESDYEFDALGRTTRELGPSHTIDLGGTATTIRRATWTVYRDDLLQVWVGRGYETGSGGSAVDTLVNPVTITQSDEAGRSADVIQAVRASTSGALTASDTFPQSSWSRWTRNSYDAQNHLDSQRVYFLIPISGDGTAGTNYNESFYGYDASDRQNRSVTPGGTITRTVYHPQGWPLQTWVGTNDAGATDNDPSGGGTAGNNMVDVRDNQYDGGLAGGDGNLTQITLNRDATDTRITTFSYDYRDRRVYTNPPTGFTVTYALDNQDRVVQVDHDARSTGILMDRSQTLYDLRGQVYQTIVYGVDQSTGTVGNALTSNRWYDSSGNIVKQQDAGASLFKKTVHDGAGRITVQYSAYNLTDTSYPYPVNVSADTVIQQVESTYNEANDLIALTTRERDHNATGTGALSTSAGTQPQARVSYQAWWPDALGRTVNQVNYGTNGSAAWSRPATAPARADTILVTSTSYDSAGNVFQVTDPQGMVVQSSYDQAGRLTQTLNDVVAGGTGPDQNQEVDCTYNADSRIATLTAKNSTTGDQVTQFVYGTTLADSDVASNDLLVQKVYPANTVSVPDAIAYAYNRLNEVKLSTDSNGTAHTYVYDVLGRPQHDRVTTLGSGVDGAVRRISRTYSGRGLLTQITSYDNGAVGSGSVVNDVMFSYNDFSQLSADYQSHSGAVNPSTTLQVQYAYADGSANTVRPTGITYPNGGSVGYAYGASGGLDDALSRLESISQSGATVASFAYLGLDARVVLGYPLTGVQLTLVGTPGGDGGDQYVGLDRFGRLVDQRWTNGSGVDIERVQFGYLRASMPQWRANTVAMSLDVVQQELYGYDGLHQLHVRRLGTLNAAKNGIVGTAVAEEDFTYDPLGNWTNYETRTSGTITLNQARTHNVDNEVATLAGVSTLVGYDQVGNMTTTPQPASWSSRYTLKWDAWNRLVKVQSGASLVATYAYDGLTRRVSQAAGGSARDYYYSDQWKVVEERVSSAPTVAERQFLWRGCAEDKLILRYQPGSGTVLYALDDGKNVTALCDGSGAIQERYCYAAFGAPAFMDGSFGTRTSSSYGWETLFCGYRFDAETAFYQVRYRYLHAQLGRWLSRDPIEEWDSLNLFLALGNNPEVHVDRDGLSISGADCDAAVDAAKKDPLISKELDVLLKQNCEPKIKCCSCEGTFSDSRFANTTGLTVTICTNNFSNLVNIVPILKHELLHVYDNCTRNDCIPPGHDACYVAACRELRAYRYQGVCPNFSGKLFEQCLIAHALKSLEPITGPKAPCKDAGAAKAAAQAASADGCGNSMNPFCS